MDSEYFELARRCIMISPAHPAAFAAQHAVTASSGMNPFEMVHVAGWMMTRWQAKIFEAQITARLSEPDVLP